MRIPAGSCPCARIARPDEPIEYFSEKFGDVVRPVNGYSLFLMQNWFALHFPLHTSPPQSISVSCPFLAIEAKRQRGRGSTVDVVNGVLFPAAAARVFLWFELGVRGAKPDMSSVICFGVHIALFRFVRIRVDALTRVNCRLRKETVMVEIVVLVVAVGGVESIELVVSSLSGETTPQVQEVPALRGDELNRTLGADRSGTRGTACAVARACAVAPAPLRAAAAIAAPTRAAAPFRVTARRGVGTSVHVITAPVDAHREDGGGKQEASEHEPNLRALPPDGPDPHGTQPDPGAAPPAPPHSSAYGPGTT
jgi:hypothetical protein